MTKLKQLQKGSLKKYPGLNGIRTHDLWPALSWLDSSVGRALHRHRRGHGFESRSSPTFFRRSFRISAMVIQLLYLSSAVQIFCISYIPLQKLS